MPRGGLRPGSGAKQMYRYNIGGVIYGTLKEAVEKLGVTKSAICKWCKEDGRDDCFKEPIKKTSKIAPVKTEVKNKAKKKSKKIKPGKHEPTQLNPQDPAENLTPDSTLAEINNAAKVADMTPLDFFLSIMKDVEEEKDLRIKVAYYAAPYMHPKGLEKVGKKDKIKEKAEKAGSGKFAQGEPPLKVIK